MSDLCGYRKNLNDVQNPFVFYFQANTINIALEKGHVLLNLNNKIWKSNKQYHDGQWHYLTVRKRGERYEKAMISYSYIINCSNIRDEGCYDICEF